VRQADHICVVDNGRVVELGSHDELMTQRGRYQTMFDLQAQRFADDVELDEHGEQMTHETLI
jgi:ABC-type transport system involved in cytochrome bd biosynthesis fused ATPase/permease subunit